MTNTIFTDNDAQSDKLQINFSLIMIHSMTNKLFTDNDTQSDKLTFH
jgi:hypothetical protein